MSAPRWLRNAVRSAHAVLRVRCVGVIPKKDTPSYGGGVTETVSKGLVTGRPAPSGGTGLVWPHEAFSLGTSVRRGELKAPPAGVLDRRELLALAAGWLGLGASCRGTPVAPRPIAGTPTPTPGPLPRLRANTTLLEAVADVTPLALARTPTAFLARADAGLRLDGRVLSGAAWNLYFALQGPLGFTWDLWELRDDGLLTYEPNASRIGAIEFSDLLPALRVDSPRLAEVALAEGLQECLDKGSGFSVLQFVLRFRFGLPTAEMRLLGAGSVVQGEVWVSPTTGLGMFRAVQCSN